MPFIDFNLRVNICCKLHESDGVMLSGMKTSAGSIIKTQAARTAKDSTYKTLNDEQKNTVWYASLILPPS